MIHPTTLMLKRYLTTYNLLGLLLLTASCTQDESAGADSGSENGLIEFRAALPQLTTRATEISGSSLANFEVSSFTIGNLSDTPYFLNKTFSKNATTGKFISSDQKCIWPDNNESLRFIAYAPSCEAMRLAGKFEETDFTFTTIADGETIADSEYKLSNFKVAQDIASQIDFITAIATGQLKDKDPEEVTLDFQHQLSRIELKAWGASNSYDIEIAGVRLGGVATQGVFSFTSATGATDAKKGGIWESVVKGNVEYIFRDGDYIVTLDKKEGSPLSADKAVSILGAGIGDVNGYDNSAMVIPSNNAAWAYKNNADNGASHTDGMYFSVLLRVTDTTPYDNGNLIYPYSDENDGKERVYIAVDKSSPEIVKTRVYRQGNSYFTDAAFTSAYDIEANNAEVKAYGWAALPVNAQWEPGHIYTYTLNYSDGVGLIDPRDPNPGEPIISDKVIVNVDVADWIAGSKTDVSVPRK